MKVKVSRKFRSLITKTSFTIIVKIILIKWQRMEQNCSLRVLSKYFLQLDCLPVSKNVIMMKLFPFLLDWFCGCRHFLGL